MTSTQLPQIDTDQFAERIFGAALGAIDTWSMFVGDKLGLYRALGDNGPMTRDELASTTGMHARYAHEWLEQQVTAGILTVDDPLLGPDRRHYMIGAAQREVLTDPDSLAYLAPFIRLLVAGGIQLPALLEAYRSGGGVSWSQFGPDMRSGQAEMNRPWFMKHLGSTWFPSVPDIHQRLGAGARVADVGCGEGWSSIAMAHAYANVTVDGFDIDQPSIDAARNHAAKAGVSDRVRFHAVDAATVGEEAQFDLVTAFECIHDLPHPVAVLATMRSLAKADGHVVIMDEAVGERFGDRTDEIERLMYGFSMFVCLPDAMSHEGSVGTGTVLRPATLAEYARQAGFAGVEVLPIQNDLWRFYRLALT